jgi:hypothetical protein
MVILIWDWLSSLMFFGGEIHSRFFIPMP